MRKAAVISVCGLLLILLGGCMSAALVVALVRGSSGELTPFGVAIGITEVVGVIFYRAFRRDRSELGGREGFAIVALGWVLLSAFGALPFWLAHDGIPSYLDACFETMSGFTTTGASILSDIEALPDGLLFWRSLTHWLGGMGIVVLTVAILPFLGAGGAQMLRAEVPGPTADKLQPRIAQTAKILWTVYLVLTVAQVLLLLPAMDWFDATCHAFGTLATGGFSTLNASIAQYDSTYVDAIITIFMVVAGANFVLHYRLLVGKGLSHLWDAEFRFYFCMLAVFTVVIATFLFLDSYPERASHPEKYESFSSCFRFASFQVASVTTTTGFVTADFDRWPNACRFLLVLMMVIGGCAGSTGGGVKVVRILVLIKYGLREIRRLVRPHAVIPLKIGGQVIDRDVVARVMGFLGLYLLLFAAAVFAMTLILGSAASAHPEAPVALDHSLLTSFGSVLATIGNVGPGLAAVGPVENYASIPALGKGVLIFCMLLGRLEIYSVMVVLVPVTWRR